MKTVALTVLSIFAGLVAHANAASAFHPFDEPMGYQLPERLKKGSARAAPPKPQTAKPVDLFSFDVEEDDAPAKPAKKQVAIKNPPVLDGGGRPAIQPSAPPVVAFPNTHGAGVVVIDTGARALYYVLSSTTAYRYPISVGREGFAWTGTEKITRVASWPDWRPPAEMKERKPELPDLMTGGVRNPLGAKALYLGNSLYRIHGTNDVGSIGQAASSGCFRMMNSQVLHLAGLAGVGTTVKVLPRLPTTLASKVGSGRRG
jgi:lipoprotein-anchoring transpeptidase ErfK/SrfK